MQPNQSVWIVSENDLFCVGRSCMISIASWNRSGNGQKKGFHFMSYVSFASDFTYNRSAVCILCPAEAKQVIGLVFKWIGFDDIELVEDQSVRQNCLRVASPRIAALTSLPLISAGISSYRNPMNRSATFQLVDSVSPTLMTRVGTTSRNRYANRAEYFVIQWIILSILQPVQTTSRF